MAALVLLSGRFFLPVLILSVALFALASSVGWVGLGREGSTKDSGAVTASLELDVGVPTKTPDSSEEFDEVEERLAAMLVDSPSLL